ncbi:MAG: LCP family protein [Clostridia bacterium]|nr:LCP family protein [Clostridia bacterium]
MASLKRNLLTFLITFVVSLLVFTLIAIPIIAYIRSEIGGNKSGKNEATEQSLETEPEENIPISKKVIDGESFTVLLVGNDYLGDNSHSCADAIMLMRFSCETGKAVFLPIPGNTQITLSGSTTTLSDFYNTKCKTEYDSRDVSVLEAKIEEITGCNIDYYICTSLSANSVGKLVDSIGGVEFFVPYDMKESIPASKFEIDLDKGKQTLDGEEATAMLRYLDDKDYESRNALCADFISVLLSNCTRKILDTQVISTFESLGTKTNITEEVINKYLATVYKYNEFEEIFLTYPGDYQTIDGSVWFYSDNYKAKEMLKQYN